MDIPVIGVGASAGGLEALREVFQANRSETGMAYVVIQHLDPTHESQMAQLIERYTDMDVKQAEGGETLEANQIYVIPPAHGLAINDNVLELTEFTDPRGMRRPIDDFFESLALARGNLAACVILSGTGADGSRGLRAIKEHGGLCIAQDPNTARYDGMPVSAIGTGLVDIIAPPEQILDSLRQFFDRRLELGDIEDRALLVSDHIDDLCDVMRETLGHDFSSYKRATLTRRISRRMQVLGIENGAEYLTRVQSDETECDALFRDLLINVTRFFRDKEEFETLNETVIDPLIAEAKDGQEVRVWVPGCSSGEEAYTIAMMIAAAMKRHKRHPYVQVLATDIDDKMLDIARSGTYPLASLQDIPAEYRNEYVTWANDHISISQKIRDMCRFAVHNLISDPPFSKMDLVSCRNLLIYFDDSQQRRVIPLFHFALRESGWLFLGSSETIGRYEDLFKLIDFRARLFQKKNVKNSYTLQINDLLRGTAQKPASSTTDAARPRVHSSEVTALKRIADHYAPVSLLTDDEGYLLEKWGAASKYLEFPDRMERRVHVPTLARKGLREVIGPLLREVRSTAKRAVSRGVEITTDFGSLSASVLCEPVNEATYLIVIKETGALEPFGGDDIDEFDVADGQMQFLEEELQATRHRLRSTVEELETTNEELKSSNEEMMSMNEELQSTNEELTTVNDELKTKVDQLTVANADLRNFLDSTELNVLVVDENLEIRSFTEAATSLFPITEKHVGRALDDIPTMLRDREFVRMATDAASSGKIQEFRTSTLSEERRELVGRVLPYRRLDGTLDGATLIFTDVTEALSLERNLREERERLRLALDVAKVGVWEYEPSTDRTVLDDNERELLDIGPDDDGDSMAPILAKLSSQDRDRINTALRKAMDGENDYDEIFQLPLRDGGERWLHGLGRRINEGDNKKFIGVTYDITPERKLLQQRELMIREMNHRVKNLFAVIAAMVSISVRETDDSNQLAKNLRGRIHALGRSHSLTSDGSADLSIKMRDLVQTVMEPTLSHQKLEVEGDETVIPRSQLTPLALIFHEWATNSVKYGALSASDGALAVSWTCDDGIASIEWEETGVSETENPSDSGFGTTLVEATARQLNGTITGEATPKGYRRTLEFKLAV